MKEPQQHGHASVVGRIILIPLLMSVAISRGYLFDVLQRRCQTGNNRQSCEPVLGASFRLVHFPLAENPPIIK